ncbi:MAG: hypothetical protein U9R53_09880 [Chloroflexota bacterium]|nr:hypothetical protein [Chloroflexota bacterium]
MSEKCFKIQNVNGFRSVSWQGLGIFLVSGASLCFEINLTRIFSVSQFYHFAFMVVSIALLGYGASGTFLALLNRKPVSALRRWLPWMAGGAGVSMIGSYLLINLLPFDSYSIAVNPKQIVVLLCHYAALASPFFFSGLIISLLLRQYPASRNKVYAMNLVGSAAGCLAAVLAPTWVGGEGMVALSASIAALSGLFFWFGDRQPGYRGRMQRKGLLGFLTAILIFTLFIIGWNANFGEVPGFFDLKISAYKSLSYALQSPEAHVVSSKWNSYSRVDVINSPSLHSVPGLSYRYTEPLPDIQGMFVDGDNLNAILPSDADLAFASYLPASAAYELRPGSSVLVLNPMGGMDIQAALELGANHVKAVESNRLVIDAALTVYNLDDVDLVVASGRSYLHRGQQRFDIIQLPLTDSYHPVSSGAYALGEDYRYTVESVQDMIKRLQPEGLLVITRWLQEEPSEWLRTFALVVTALEGQNLDPSTQIVALRGYNTGTLLVKRSPFTSEEIETLRIFSEEKAFDLAFGPGLDASDINRYNILPEPIYFQTFQSLLSTNPREDFYDAYPYAVQPPTDDHPFFGHYFKWSQLEDILSSLGVTWQPFGGAGYLVVLVILALALLLAGILILLPVMILKRNRNSLHQGQVPLYFASIGFAYLLVEMPLIQRFILYLDQPAYAFTAVLFCILLFSGLGSRFGSRKLALSKVFLILVGLLMGYVFLLPQFLHATLGFPLTARLALTVLLVAPLGFLMGIPFPSGLERMGVHHLDPLKDQWLVAWVWAINGACSVIASIIASLLSFSFGLGITFVVGVSFYAFAWLISAVKSQ